MLYDAAMLEYLAWNLPHPVPKVVAHDESTKKALGMGYMIQEHLPGVPLSEL